MGILAKMIDAGALEVQTEEPEVIPKALEEEVPYICFGHKTIVKTNSGVHEFVYYDEKYDRFSSTVDEYDATHCCPEYVDLVLKFHRSWGEWLEKLAYCIIHRLVTLEESYSLYRLYLDKSVEILIKYNPIYGTYDGMDSSLINSILCIAPSLKETLPQYPREKSVFELAEEKGPDENGIILICQGK